jgi:hypothetical protein
MLFSYVPVAAALALLKHAECDDAQNASAAIEFPPLLALASTCRALRAALQPRRVQLAKACWLRAFGAESLGACAAWQRTEQLGGSAFEARWRWLHRLRISKKSTRAESIVEHVLPSRAQLQEVEAHITRDEVKYAFGDGATQLTSWLPSSAALLAGGGVDGTPLLEALSLASDELPCRLTFALRTGAILHIKASVVELPIAAFGGIGVELQVCRRYAGNEVSLQDLTKDSILHVLSRSVDPQFVNGVEHWHWATHATWSADGTRLAVWGKHRTLVGAQPDSATIAVYVFELDAANPPPPGSLRSAHVLLLPKFASLAFGGGSGDRVYTAECAIDGTGTLKAWDVSSGLLLVEAVVTMNQYHCVIVPFRSVLCISLDSPSIDVRCTSTLAHVGRLECAPLLGGHGTRVVAMRGVAYVLLSCDENGVLLAWHVPTRQLLHRLGRDVWAAPLAGHLLTRNFSGLALTSRGAAMLEIDYERKSQTRLFDWLP